MDSFRQASGTGTTPQHQQNEQQHYGNHQQQRVSFRYPPPPNSDTSSSTIYHRHHQSLVAENEHVDGSSRFGDDAEAALLLLAFSSNANQPPHVAVDPPSSEYRYKRDRDFSFTDLDTSNSDDDDVISIDGDYYTEELSMDDTQTPPEEQEEESEEQLEEVPAESNAELTPSKPLLLFSSLCSINEEDVADYGDDEEEDQQDNDEDVYEQQNRHLRYVDERRVGVEEEEVKVYVRDKGADHQESDGEAEEEERRRVEAAIEREMQEEESSVDCDEGDNDDEEWQHAHDKVAEEEDVQVSLEREMENEKEESVDYKEDDDDDQDSQHVLDNVVKDHVEIEPLRVEEEEEKEEYVPDPEEVIVDYEESDEDEEEKEEEEYVPDQEEVIVDYEGSEEEEEEEEQEQHACAEVNDQESNDDEEEEEHVLDNGDEEHIEEEPLRVEFRDDASTTSSTSSHGPILLLTDLFNALRDIVDAPPLSPDSHDEDGDDESKRLPSVFATPRVDPTFSFPPSTPPRRLSSGHEVRTPSSPRTPTLAVRSADSPNNAMSPYTKHLLEEFMEENPHFGELPVGARDLMGLVGKLDRMMIFPETHCQSTLNDLKAETNVSSGTLASSINAHGLFNLPRSSPIPDATTNSKMNKPRRFIRQVGTKTPSSASPSASVNVLSSSDLGDAALTSKPSEYSAGYDAVASDLFVSPTTTASTPSPQASLPAFTFTVPSTNTHLPPFPTNPAVTPGSPRSHKKNETHIPHSDDVIISELRRRVREVQRLLDEKEREYEVQVSVAKDTISLQDAEISSQKRGLFELRAEKKSLLADLESVSKARSELQEEHERLKERFFALKKKDEETRKSEESYRKAFDDREEELVKTKKLFDTLRRESINVAEAYRSLLAQHTQLQAEMASASDTIQALTQLNDEVTKEKDAAMERLEVLKRRMSSGSDCGSVGRLCVVAEDDDEANVIKHEVQEVQPFILVNADDDEHDRVEKPLPDPRVETGEGVTSEEADTDGLDEKPNRGLRPLDEELCLSGWSPGVNRQLRRRGEDDAVKNKEKSWVLAHDDGDESSSDEDGDGECARRVLFKKYTRSPPRPMKKTLVESATQYEALEIVGTALGEAVEMVVPPVAAAAEAASLVSLTVASHNLDAEQSMFADAESMDKKISAFRCSACGTRCGVQAIEKAEVGVQIDAFERMKPTLTESSTQMDAPTLTDNSTEMEIVETFSSSTQVEPVVLVTSGCQAAAPMTTIGTGMDVLEFSSSGVQVSPTSVEFGTQIDESICGTVRCPDSVVLAALTSDREGDDAVQCEGTQTYIEILCVQTQASSEVASFGIQVGTTPEVHDSSIQAVADADTVETQTITPPEMCTAAVQVEAVVTATATQDELTMAQAAVQNAGSVLGMGVQAMPRAEDVVGVGVQVCPEMCVVETQALVGVVSSSAESEQLERREFQVQTDTAVVVEGAVQTKVDPEDVVCVAVQAIPMENVVSTVEVSAVAIQNVVETTQQGAQACVDVVEQVMQTQVDAEEVGGVAVQVTPEVSSVAAEAVPVVTEVMVQAIADVQSAEIQMAAAVVVDAINDCTQVMDAKKVEVDEEVVGDDHILREREAGERKEGIDEDDTVPIGNPLYYTSIMRRRNIAAMYYFDEIDDEYHDDGDSNAVNHHQHARKCNWWFRCITTVLLLVIFGTIAIQFVFPMLAGRMITATRLDEFGRPIKETYRTGGITVDENGWM
ncbi:hypothetical protein HK102_000727, partial [Quaeritorhiza haematococci]